MTTKATSQPAKMSDSTCTATPADSQPVISDSEADRRSLLLGQLQAALAERGVQAVVARHQRLALGSVTRSVGASGRTDPKLHIYVPDGTTLKAVTNATVYRLDDGEEYLVSDPGAVAAAICGQHVQSSPDALF